MSRKSKRATRKDLEAFFERFSNLGLLARDNFTCQLFGAMESIAEHRSTRLYGNPFDRVISAVGQCLDSVETKKEAA